MAEAMRCWLRAVCALKQLLLDKRLLVEEAPAPPGEPATSLELVTCAYHENQEVTCAQGESLQEEGEEGDDDGASEADGSLVSMSRRRRHLS